VREVVDLAIVGAGPAGMSAALAACELGVDVLVLDEQAAPGGQIYRNVETVAAGRPNAAHALGEDYLAGAALVGEFRECGARYLPNTSVWELASVSRRRDAEAPFEIGIVRGGVAEIVRARCVIVATGAQERAVPIPGATLPGVMSVGAAQTLLKSSGLVPDAPAVIAGSGPLVYPVAGQLLRAGAPLRAVLFTAAPAVRIRRRVRALPAALAMPRALRKGLAWHREIARAGIETLNVCNLAIDGVDRVESVRFTHRGQSRSMPAPLVLLHEGVVPNVHLTLATQIEHVWDERQHGFRPVRDKWGNTSEPGLLVAGDSAGVLGAEAAMDTGRVAALEAAHRLGRIDSRRRDALARPHRTALARHQRFREFLDLAFEPDAAVLCPSDPTVTLCRCEEVTVAEIDRVIAHGCLGPNQAKAFTRCGMGPCQGRMCATLVSEIFAKHRRTSVGEVGHYRIRPPVKPLTVGELAGLEKSSSPPAESGSALFQRGVTCATSRLLADGGSIDQ